MEPIPVAEPPASSAPVMDVTPPPAEKSSVPESKPEPKPEAAKPVKPAATKVDKPKRQGTGAAIFATVVIVLALSAMATFAYIKTR